MDDSFQTSCVLPRIKLLWQLFVFLQTLQALRQVVFGQCPASVRTEFFAQGILPTTMFSRLRVSHVFCKRNKT
jgi:hypothetical protein